MNMLDKEHVKRVAILARLSITEEETSMFTEQLGSIIHYIDQLNAVDTNNVEPTAFLSPEHDPLRDDKVQPSLPQEDLLKNGPSVKKGCFAVPKVMTH
jgi:aspartyl-tRNA(Asn)/glutamyl-tRNA(Gln) amidotransferase subunit C